jgi:hypothetical protein
MNQVNIQKAADLSIKVDSTSLDVSPEERAGPHVKNRSRQTQAITMQQAPDTHTIADFHLCHGSLFSNKILRQAPKIICSWTFSSKHFSVKIPGGYL